MVQARSNKIVRVVARGCSIDLGLEEGRRDQKLGKGNQQKTCSGASQGERYFTQIWGDKVKDPQKAHILGLTRIQLIHMVLERRLRLSGCTGLQNGGITPVPDFLQGSLCPHPLPLEEFPIPEYQPPPTSPGV